MKLLRHVGLLVPLLSIAAVTARGEKHITPALSLSKLAPSIVAGRAVADNTLLPIVLIYHPLPDGTFSTCTGTIVDGCLVTGAHCLYEGVEQYIAFGTKPSLKQPATFLTKKVFVGSATDPHTDIAVAALNFPVSDEVSLDLKYLSKERFDPNQDKDATLIALGYGARGTTDGPNGVPQNFGAGIKRRGVVAFDGYSPAIKQDGTWKKAPGKGTPALWVKRGPSIIAEGDSGGPLFINNQIYGFASSGIASKQLESNPDEPARPKTPFADEIDEGLYASAADNYEGILKAMAEAGCRGDLIENVVKKMSATLKDVAAAKDWKKKWAQLSADERALLGESARRLMNLPVAEKVTLEPSSAKEGIVQFSVKTKSGNPDHPQFFQLDTLSHKVNF